MDHTISFQFTWIYHHHCSSHGESETISYKYAADEQWRNFWGQTLLYFLDEDWTQSGTHRVRSCTSKLQLKVNCRPKVNCGIKFGLPQPTGGRPAQKNSYNSLVHDPALYHRHSLKWPQFLHILGSKLPTVQASTAQQQCWQPFTTVLSRQCIGHCCSIYWCQQQH